MNVIKLNTLRAFWQSKMDIKAERVLTEWYWVCKAAAWRTFVELRSTFRHADQVTLRNGKTVTVFDVGGNDYRVIAQVWYEKQTMMIRFVLTHREYDKGTWKEQI